VFVYAYLCTVFDKKALKTRELHTYIWFGKENLESC